MITQKFTIQVTDSGLVIQEGENTRLEFSPVEALMLLDILKNEESAIKRMAEKATPFPARIRFQ